MALKTRAVTGTVYTPDGKPAAGAKIQARLNRFETDGGIVVPFHAETKADENGNYTINLWPNERGTGSSSYRVTVRSASPQDVSFNVVVPDGNGALSMDPLIDRPPYPPIDQAQEAIQKAQAAASTAVANAQVAENAASQTGTDASNAEAASLAAQQAASDAQAIAVQFGDVQGAIDAATSAANSASSAASTATGAADTASDKALEAAQSAAEAGTSAQVKVDELKTDLADPSKGAAMVAYDKERPYESGTTGQALAQVEADVDATQKNISAIWNSLGPTPPGAVTLIDMHTESLKSQGWTTGESGGIVTRTTSTAASAGGTILSLNSPAFVADQLICYEAGGEWYSARVSEASGTTIELHDPLEAPLPAGATVSNFYNNISHPNQNGYYTIADYALRERVSHEVASVLKNVLWQKQKTSDVLTSNASDHPNNPGSSEFPSRRIECHEIGGGTFSFLLPPPFGDYYFEIIINTYGGRFNVRAGETSGGISTFVIEQTIQVSRPTRFILPMRRETNGELTLSILALDDGDSTADFIVSYALKPGAFTRSFDYGKHVLYGDSWFAQEHLFERLKQRLPHATIVNKGVGGRTSANLWSNFDAEVAPEKPDFVWLMCGTNDYYLNVLTAGFYMFMNRVVTQCKSIGAMPIVFTPSVGSVQDDTLRRSRAFRYVHDFRDSVAPYEYETQVISFAGLSVSAGSTIFVGSVGRTRLPAVVLEAYAAGVNQITFGYSTGMAQPTIDVLSLGGNTILNRVPVPKSDENERYFNVGVVNSTGSDQVCNGFVRVMYLPFSHQY